MSAADVTPRWGTFLNVEADVKPALQIPATQTAYDVWLETVTAAACHWIQDYLARPIALTEFYRRFDGYSGLNGQYIQLPYYPVFEVAEVKEWWGTSGPHVLSEQTPEQQANTNPGQAFGDTYSLDRLHGTVTRTMPGLIARPWFPSVRGVEITWTAGFDPIPPHAKLAATFLVDYWYRQTQEAVREDRTGLQQYGADAGPSLWPAVPNRVTALLEPFVQVAIA